MRRSVTGVGLLIGLTLLAVGGCAGRGAAVPQPQATPYTGPLRVEPPETGPDHSGGAAGLAVRCRTAPVGYNDVAGKHAGEVSGTPEAALSDHLPNGSAVHGASREYRKAADDRERVLFIYAPEGVPVQALVARHGESMDGHTGWYIESFASCNPAEFPESDTRGTGSQIWTNPAGRRALTTEIVSSEGPEHCNWQHLTFL